jgi:hypothetical protein
MNFFILISMMIMTACGGQVPAGKAKPSPSFTVASTSKITSTSTHTPSPTQTPKPTVTPKPPVHLEICPSTTCSGDEDQYFQLNSSTDTNTVYEVNIPENQNLSFRIAWWVQDEEILQKNLELLDFYFLVDGQDYWTNAMLGDPEPYVLDNVPDDVFTAAVAGVTISDWKIGESHEFRLGAIAKEELFDGWSIYSPGMKLEIIMKVTPVQAATNTPEPPACEENSSIKIDNATGGYLSLNLVGPTDYSFEIPPGTNSYYVCTGAYSYTAFGCGVTVHFGSIISGSSSEFYCQ